MSLSKTALQQQLAAALKDALADLAADKTSDEAAEALATAIADAVDGYVRAADVALTPAVVLGVAPVGGGPVPANGGVAGGLQ